MNLRANLIGVALVLFCLSDNFAQEAFDHSYRDALGEVDSLILFAEWDKALAVAYQLEDVYRESENWSALVRCLTSIARTHMEAGNYAEVLSYLEEVEELASEYLEKDYPEQGLLWQQWAMFYAGADTNLYKHKIGSGNRDSLISTCFEKALGILESCCIERNRLMGHFYANRARCTEDSGERIELLEKAIDHYALVRDGLNLWHVQSLVVLAKLKREIGETEVSFELARSAQSLLGQLDTSSHQIVQDLDLEIAERLYRKKEFEKSNEIYQKLYDRELTYSEKSLEKLARFKMHQGANYIHLGDSSALPTLLDAERLLFDLSEPDHSTLGLIRWYVGWHFQSLEEYDSAREWYLRSTEEFYKVDDTVEISENLWYLAELALETGSPMEALDYIDESLNLAGYQWGDFASGTLLENRNIDDFFNPLEARGRILYHLYEKTGNIDYLHESLQTYQVIEMMAEQVRSGLYSEATNLVVSEHFYRAAAGALRTLSLLDQIEDDLALKSRAFGFIEHNRYAQLYQEWDRAQRGSSIGVPDSISDRLQSYRSEMQRLESTRSGAATNEWVVIQDSLAELTRQYERIRNQIKVDYPAYFQIRYDSMVSLTEAQNLLEEGAQVVEYLWQGNWISILSYHRDTALLVTIPDSQVADDLNKLLPWMTMGMVDDAHDLSFSDFSTLARRLYENLVKPFVDTSNRKLIISPDGDLSLLPFEVLLSGDGEGFALAPYLIYDWEIQYIQSVNVLVKNNKPVSLRRPDLLAMAYSERDDQGRSLRNGFDEIPHSGVEVKAVADAFDHARISVLQGNNATESAFKESISNYDIIHLAVHGKRGDDNVLESHLVFKSETDSLEGSLFSYELYPLRLDRLKLAVLSACETGLGKSLDGEGVFSVARGFAYAGTPSMVMSLWEVDDRYTAQLMQSFYQHLNQGQAVGNAMRNAKLSFLGQASNIDARPYNWAAFIAMGDTSLAIEANNRWWIILLIALIVLSVGFYFRGRFRSQTV